MTDDTLTEDEARSMEAGEEPETGGHVRADDDSIEQVLAV